MTLDSALEQARGRGGTWKGRAQAQEIAGGDRLRRSPEEVA